LDNKVRELTAVKVLHTSLLKTTLVAFKVLPLGSYAPMPEPSTPFKAAVVLLLMSSKCIHFNISFIFIFGNPFVIKI
jgi:hypothetical protein